MKKQPVEFLKSYARRLSEHEIQTLYLLFKEKLAGDYAEAIGILQRAQDLDRWLSSAATHDEFFQMLDLVEENVTNEYKKRYELIRT